MVCRIEKRGVNWAVQYKCFVPDYQCRGRRKTYRRPPYRCADDEVCPNPAPTNIAQYKHDNVNRPAERPAECLRALRDRRVDFVVTRQAVYECDVKA